MSIRANKKILLSMGVSLSVIVLADIILTFGTPSGAISFISLGLIVAGLLIGAGGAAGPMGSLGGGHASAQTLDHGPGLGIVWRAHAAQQLGLGLGIQADA